FLSHTADAYERLLLDVMLGDSTLFTRRDEVEAEWSIVDPILHDWEAEHAPDFPNYEAGRWGPSAATDLIESDGYSWLRV
ncbi:MAG: glucose-6-phosphate dehydrogenase, partial [Chloroflexota bacterium]